MSDDFGVDLDELLRVVERASVLIIRFDVLEPRLLVDFRAEAADPPMIRLVDRVNSAEERYRHLKSLRPRVPLPERILTFAWPRGIRAFADCGLWEQIEGRLVRLGADAEQVQHVQADMLARERAVILAAITGGDGFRTLWER